VAVAEFARGGLRLRLAHVLVPVVGVHDSQVIGLVPVNAKEAVNRTPVNTKEQCVNAT